MPSLGVRSPCLQWFRKCGKLLIQIFVFLQESSMRALRGGDTQAATKSSLADIEKRKKGKLFLQVLRIVKNARNF